MPKHNINIGPQTHAQQRRGACPPADVSYNLIYRTHKGSEYG